VHHRSKYSTACSTAAAVHTSAYDLLSVDATPYIGPIQIVEVEGGDQLLLLLLLLLLLVQPTALRHTFWCAPAAYTGEL
jgi:hypothetical protein